MIEEEAVRSALKKHNIRQDDMHADVNRKTLDFFEKCAEEYVVKAPGFAVVADRVEGFGYIARVTDSYSYLANKIKDYTAKKLIVDLFEPKKGEDLSEFERNLTYLSGQEFVNKWLPSVIESVKMRTSVRKDVGNTLIDIKESVKEE